MRLELKPFFARMAWDVMRQFAARLKRRLGVGGQPLAPKVQPDDQPLGGKLRQGLRQGRVTATQDGFAIDYRRIREVGLFHRGDARKNQVSRPITGLTAEERAEMVERIQAEVVRQLNRGVA